MTTPAPADIDIIARALLEQVEPDMQIVRDALHRIKVTGISKADFVALITAAFEKRQA